jgi:hypothetical protein
MYFMLQEEIPVLHTPDYKRKIPALHAPNYKEENSCIACPRLQKSESACLVIHCWLGWESDSGAIHHRICIGGSHDITHYLSPVTHKI